MTARPLMSPFWPSIWNAVSDRPASIGSVRRTFCAVTWPLLTRSIVTVSLSPIFTVAALVESLEPGPVKSGALTSIAKAASVGM